MQILLDAAQIQKIVSDLADDILADPGFEPADWGQAGGTHRIALVGIVSRGEILAQRLAEEICRRIRAQQAKDVSAVEEGGAGGQDDGNANGAWIDVGALDITLYRDDVTSRAAITIPQGTHMDFRLDDRPVILVDDVLETGRSVRAALDALVDFGRPKVIRLAVLVDRGRREFPIQADYVGLHVTETHSHQKIVVRLEPTDAQDGVYLT